MPTIIFCIVVALFIGLAIILCNPILLLIGLGIYFGVHFIQQANDPEPPHKNDYMYIDWDDDDD